jgi:hypothetical protein
MTKASVIVGTNAQAIITGYTRFEITARRIKGYGFDHSEPRRVLNLNKSNAHVAAMDYCRIAEHLDAHSVRGNRP